METDNINSKEEALKVINELFDKYNFENKDLFEIKNKKTVIDSATNKKQTILILNDSDFTVGKFLKYRSAMNLTAKNYNTSVSYSCNENNTKTYTYNENHFLLSQKNSSSNHYFSLKDYLINVSVTAWRNYAGSDTKTGSAQLKNRALAKGSTGVNNIVDVTASKSSSTGTATMRIVVNAYAYNFLPCMQV